ncbi:MAG TPA: hypothetical protein VIL36_16620 [Acidimicrobiales bacterium]
MGKASSAKKIARAARAGGRASGVRQRNLLFPGTIAAILILGVLLVGFSVREHRANANTVPPLAGKGGLPGDHWHAAYGFYVCGEWKPALPEWHDTAGIHSHNDGVIHIHPFGEAGAGRNATMGTFLEEAPDVKLSDDKLELGEESWETGKDECDGEKGELVIARWKNVQTTDDEPALIYENFDDLRFREDGEGYTIAFVPEGETDIPKPESSAQLAELGAVDSGDPSGTSVPEDLAPETTVPGETTVPAEGEAPPATDPPATDPTATTAAAEGEG